MVVNLMWFVVGFSFLCSFKFVMAGHGVVDDVHGFSKAIRRARPTVVNSGTPKVTEKDFDDFSNQIAKDSQDYFNQLSSSEIERARAQLAREFLIYGEEAQTKGRKISLSLRCVQKDTSQKPAIYSRSTLQFSVESTGKEGEVQILGYDSKPWKIALEGALGAKFSHTSVNFMGRDGSSVYETVGTIRVVGTGDYAIHMTKVIDTPHGWWKTEVYCR